MQDNEESDTEREEDRWRRTPWRFTQAALVRKAARMREEAEDEDDRMKELEEAAARTQVNNGTGANGDSGSNGASIGTARSDTAPPVAVKREAAMDPNDGIMKVRGLLA